MEIPKVESKFLNEVLIALQKRRKSMKYRFSDITCQKVYENFEARREEKIELEFFGRHTGNRPWFRFNFWEDQIVRISGRMANKEGTVWKWEYSGKLFPKYSGIEIVDAIESSCGDWNVTADNSKIGKYLDHVDKIWKPMIATGVLKLV